MPIILEDLDLAKAERLLCQSALTRAGTIVEASRLLGITRHALKRRMIRHRIEWSPSSEPTARDRPTAPELALRMDPDGT